MQHQSFNHIERFCHYLWRSMPLLAIAVWLLLPATPASADNPTFGDEDYQIEFGNPGDTYSVAVGDLNNDGFLDIVVSKVGQNYVYLNDGMEGFSEEYSLGTTNYGTQSVAVGDLNNDGFLDIVVGNHGPDTPENSGQQNFFYLNKGAGLFEEGTPFGGIDRTNSVALGDLNNDGSLDIVVGNNGQNDFFYLNDGSGNFQSGIQFGASNEGTMSVAVGDFDKDTYLDIAVVKYGQNYIYINNGTGNFASGSVDCGTVGVRCFGDIYDNNNPQNVDTQNVTVGDINGDKALDVVVGTNGGQNYVYLNNGSGTFATGTADCNTGDMLCFGNSDDGTQSVAVGDLNGDGVLDLIEANSGDTPNQLHFLDGEDSVTSSITFGGLFAQAVALADVNGDGALDVIEGRGDGADKIYLNDGVLELGTGQPYTDALHNTQGVTVGDLDGDGDLDLVASNGDLDPNANNGGQNYIYLNKGTGTFDAGIPFGGAQDESFYTAVGDLDDDGDLDLVTANFEQQNFIYWNDGAGDFSTETPIGPADGATYTVALGDLNGDKALDLVVGNFGSGNSGQKNVIYLNNSTNGPNIFPAETTFGDADRTNSIVLGDIDRDGSLDIVVGNTTQKDNAVNDPDRVYLNDGQGNFYDHEASDGPIDCNNPPDNVYCLGGEEVTFEVAIGDLNSDGWLDVVAGRPNASNHIFFNNGGTGFDEVVPFENGSTNSIALDDLNGDRRLDIIVGNEGGVNKVYLNVGEREFRSGSFPDNPGSNTNDIASGDLNGDGTVDLVVGNSQWAATDAANTVYLNQTRRAGGLLNQTPYVSITHPVTTGSANFYASPVVLKKPTIPITYTLFDPEGDEVRFIRAYFSPNGGGVWRPATPAPGTQTTDLPASAAGTSHIFTWQADADLIKSDNVLFQIEAYQGYNGPGPYQWPYASAQTFPFRVEAADWYAKVVDETERPLKGATVYLNGTESITLTDQAGLVKLSDNATSGQPLVALHQIAEQPTTRAGHDGWAYRTYLTSLNLTSDGTPQPDTVGQPGEQRLIVREKNPLILFNIVASVEWDATDEYLAMLEDAFDKASAYLYDVTDGQMAFGQVSIYDKGENWAGADFQFSTKNTVRPYAFIGGIVSDDEAHTIRVGRFWDGNSGDQGAWNEQDGYRTLIHEFGHYALHLGDAYIYRELDDEDGFQGERDAFCTDEEIETNNNDATNATIMYFHYNATELSDEKYNWDENCTYTEQYRLNQKADWKTIVDHYPQMQTPTAREGLMVGPATFPVDLLPFPDIGVTNSGQADEPSRRLTVQDEAGAGVANVLITLYTKRDGTTVPLDQGSTNRQGQIDIYGAVAGDKLRAVTIDGALAGENTVSSETTLTLPLFKTSFGQLTTQQSGVVPHLNMVPGSDGTSLTLHIQDATAGPPLNTVVIPGEGVDTPQLAKLAYAPDDEKYSGSVSFAGVGLGTGRTQVTGNVLPNNIITSDYNLQVTRQATATYLYAEDGNFELNIPPGGLPANGYATVAPTGYAPGPLPTGVQVIGSAYEVRVSGSLAELEKEGLVRLHYHPKVMGFYDNIAIYYWDAAARVWHNLGGEPNEVDNAYAVAANRLGIYALMGVPVEVPYGVYLPLIVK